jgi:hypothetical protein
MHDTGCQLSFSSWSARVLAWLEPARPRIMMVADCGRVQTRCVWGGRVRKGGDRLDKERRDDGALEP